MKLVTVRRIIATGILLFAFEAHADRTGIVDGDGTVGCGDYLQDRKNGGRDAMYADWVVGFMSSYNLFGSKSQVEHLPNQATIMAYLDKHCRDSPLSHVVTGAIQLTKDMGGMK